MLVERVLYGVPCKEVIAGSAFKVVFAEFLGERCFQQLAIFKYLLSRHAWHGW